MKKKIIYSLILLFIILVWIAYLFYLRNAKILHIPLEWNVELFLFTWWKTSYKVLKENNCTTVVNGSYFWYDENRNFIPAWIWYENWEKLYSRDNHPFDPNLTNIITFYPEKASFNFLFDKWLENSEWSWISFNAGPRLLQKNQINKNLWKDISHRKYNVPRTIISKKSDKYYINIFKKWISLENSAEYLKEKWFSDAINLDWWPSTSISSKKLYIKNLKENKKLPIFFCIH